MRWLRFFLVIGFWILSNNAVHAVPFKFSMQQMDLPQAIQALAQFLNMNVMISPQVKGNVTLQLQETSAHSAFKLLLAAHNLVAWKEGEAYFVAPTSALLKHHDERHKWKEAEALHEPLLTIIWQIKYAKALDIAHLVQQDGVSLLSARGTLRVDERANIICIQDSASKLRMIRQLLKRVDIPVQQIVIEARIASIDHDYEKELGLSFAVAPTVSSSEPRHQQGQTQRGQYSLASVVLADSERLDVKLSALEKAGHAELISSPSLFSTNQQTASIEAGEEIPYQEVSESGGTAVVFKKAVLSLKVTPQILPGNKVLLQLAINQDRPNNKLIQGVPTISTRQIVTSVLVQSGHTVVLGGIYEANQENVQAGVPYLEQLPLIGALFSERSKRKSRRELLIVVTPKIVANNL
ncbi:MAG: hypothetical protein H0W64_12365 [Gammaproteobacteria bacterium]|nr:hypothetical protein [Gammaproteobacteria bacterium]